MSKNKSLCNNCLKTKHKERSHKKPSNGWVYKDNNGGVWSSGICPDCKQLIQKQRFAEKKENEAINEIKNWHILKGRNAEKLVANVIRSCGIENIKISKNKGPDLIAERKTTKQIKPINTIAQDITLLINTDLPRDLKLRLIERCL